MLYTGLGSNIMKITILLFTLIYMLSCSDQQPTIDDLTTENLILKEQLDSLKQVYEGVDVRLLFLPEKNNLTPGDTFRADLLLCAYQPVFEPVAKFYDKESNDTIYANSLGGYARISFVPKDTGQFEYRGDFTQRFMGVEQEFPYYFQLSVSNKNAAYTK